MLPTAAQAKLQASSFNYNVAQEVAIIELSIIEALDAGQVATTVASNTSVELNSTTVTGSPMTESTTYYNVWKATVTDAAKTAEMAAIISGFEAQGYSISRKSSNNTTFYWSITWS